MQSINEVCSNFLILRKKMFSFLGYLFGIIGGIIVFIGFFPVLGWLNWIGVPFGIIGLFMSIIAGNQSARNLNIAVIVIGIIRLLIGGGVI